MKHSIVVAVFYGLLVAVGWLGRFDIAQLDAPDASTQIAAIGLPSTNF